jgi:8-oxo-dGTP diphosphatase
VPEIVVGAVIVHGSRAFVHRRGHERALFPDCWDIPGGHVDPGESPLDALRREIEEETGWWLRRVIAELGEMSWIGSDGVPRREIDYLVEVDGDLDAPRLEHPKHVEFAWVGLDDLDRLMENRSPAETLVRDVVARGLREAAKETAEPPASLMLVHGAGTGPWVYDGWIGSFPGMTVAAVDLQESIDIATASHPDYATKVVEAAAQLPAPVSLCGWSMGGLVVLQAAQLIRPHSVILLEASPPAEVQGFNPDAQVDCGTFDPELTYGTFPSGIQARPESARARAERKRGISVPRLRCRSLVVYGDAFPDERGRAIAALYGSDEIDFPGLDHWGLVRDERVRAAIARWLGAALGLSLRASGRPAGTRRRGRGAGTR